MPREYRPFDRESAKGWNLDELFDTIPLINLNHRLCLNDGTRMNNEE